VVRWPTVLRLRLWWVGGGFSWSGRAVISMGLSVAYCVKMVASVGYPFQRRLRLVRAFEDIARHGG